MRSWYIRTARAQVSSSYLRGAGTVSASWRDQSRCQIQDGSISRSGSGAALRAALLADAGTAGRAGILSALGHEFVAEADVARGLPESLPDALQGGAAAGIPPDEGVFDRSALAHGFRR
jgi:hypothetical protein